MEMPGGANGFQLEIGHVGLYENKPPADNYETVYMLWGAPPALTQSLGESQQGQSHFWVLECRAGLRWLQEMELPWQSELEFVQKPGPRRGRFGTLSWEETPDLLQPGRMGGLNSDWTWQPVIYICIYTGIAFTYVYKYICMYIYIQIYVCIYTHTRIYMYIYTYMYIHKHRYKYMCQNININININI